MATYNKIAQFVEDLSKKVHDLHADTVRVYLSNALPNFSTTTIKANIAEITIANGYTGPLDTQNTITRSGGTATMNAVDVVVTASGAVGPFQYVPVFNDTPSAPADPMIGWWDYGSAISLATGETFTVDFSANAILTLA